MDTSEKYIKMCQQAQEIQQLKNKNWENGDFLFLVFQILRDEYRVKKYKEYEGFDVGDITDSGSKCIKNEDNLYLTFEYFAKKREDCIFIYSNYVEFIDEYGDLVFNYPTDVAGFYDVNKIIWLPRQDQLQELEPIGIVMGILGQFWSDEIGFDREDELLEKYLCKFLTNEQIHLAYLMKEKYNKIWNEEQQNWI